MITTASNLLTFNVFNFFTRNTDNILVGKFLGPETLGIYSRAYKLFILPIQQICIPLGRATFPALCRAAPEDEERLKKIYLTTIGLLSNLISPGCLILAACSDWVIDLLLGPQWSEVAPIVSVLALLGALQAATHSCGNLLTACGKTRVLSKWGIVSSILTVSSFIVGLPWGALGVAAAYSISGILIRTPILLKIVERNTPIKMKSVLQAVARPVLFGSTGALAAITVRLLLPDLSSLTGCLVFSLLVLITYMILFQVGGRQRLAEFKRLT